MGLLFPLITFPYASRVLLADGIGQFNFFSSIINYIVLFTGLGIPIYGIREVARVRDNMVDLTRTTLEILILSVCLSLIGYIAVAVMCFSIPEIQSDIPLFLVISFTIISSSIGCNWFYNGIEDYKFLAINSLIVRVLSLFLLFGLVKTKDDLLYYGIYAVLTSSGNYILNFIGLHRRLNISIIKIIDLNIFKHVKPAFAVFMFSIVTSIYVNLDKVMLGFIKDTESVGYYAVASQISHMLLFLVISLGTVLLPRASNLVKNDQMEEFLQLSEKAYHFIMLLSLPIVAGCLILSPSLIHIVCGYSYDPSIMTLRLISPTIIVIGLSQLIGMQILYPLGKIKIVTYCTCIGAAVNLLMNSVLIPLWAHDGAAISSVAAEACVTISLIIIAKKYIDIRFFSSSFYKILFSTIIMSICCLCVISFVCDNDWLCFIIVPILGGTIYLVLLLCLRDELVMDSMNTVRDLLKR